MLLASVVARGIGLAGLEIAPDLLLVAVSGALAAIGSGACQAVNWALLGDDMEDGQGASAFGLANLATAGAGALAGLFGPRWVSPGRSCRAAPTSSPSGSPPWSPSPP